MAPGSALLMPCGIALVGGTKESDPGLHVGAAHALSSFAICATAWSRTRALTTPSSALNPLSLAR